MRVLHVCSELYPLLKTGGLADVTAALPPALSEIGVDSRVLVPGFPAFMNNVEEKELLIELSTKFDDQVSIFLAKIPNTKIKIYVIDAPDLYDRPGNPYTDEDNKEYADNYKRFALLGWVAAELVKGLDCEWIPNIVHGHDWHSGLVPTYIKAAEMTTGIKSVKTVFTIHNLAYQGLFPVDIFPELGLPSDFLGMNGMEFYGQISFLKSGLHFADKITTVSPTYAKEIQSHEQGCGLDGLLSKRKNDLYGILNGVDPSVWNPRIDPVIKNKYTKESVAISKAKNKSFLQKSKGLKVQNTAPLFGLVSRLTEQKGLHLVIAGLEAIISKGGQLVLLGSGDRILEGEFKAIAEKYPEFVSVQIGYDEKYAHQIVAACDVILVPSRFEPCGLTQLYGLVYGTLPLVHKVGGLADTVTDTSLENLADNTATGFVFEKFSVEDYKRAIRRAFALYDRKVDWRKVREIAMQQDVSWSAAADRLHGIYQQLIKEID